MPKTLRRYQNILVTSGWGFIILGIFPILQTLMFYYLMPEESGAYLDSINYGDASRGGMIAITLVFLGIEFLFHVLAGRGAILEGTGKKRSAACVIFGFICLFLTLVRALSFALSTVISQAAFDLESTLLIILLFFTLFINIQMLVALFVVRIQRKKAAMAH